MSFAKQLSLCKTDGATDVTPTDQDLALSRLRRPGMHGKGWIRQILPPGKFAFDPTREQQWRPVSWRETDVVDERADDVRKPRLVRVDHVSWHQSQGLSWVASIPTPSSKINVPIEYADDASLGYYDCRLIYPGDVITLSYRSLITPFCYEDGYLEQHVVGVNGSSKIEQHEFAHVDIPLDHRSGLLVIGRIDPYDHALELTAFIARPPQRVYIPAMTIHTNDYLLGTWETLLSSACIFPSAEIKYGTAGPSAFGCKSSSLPFIFV